MTWGKLIAFWEQNSQNPLLQVRWPAEVGTHHRACTDAPGKLGAGAGSSGAKDSTPGGMAGVAARWRSCCPVSSLPPGQQQQTQDRVTAALCHVLCAGHVVGHSGQTWGGLTGLCSSSHLTFWSVWCWGRV